MIEMNSTINNNTSIFYLATTSSISISSSSSTTTTTTTTTTSTTATTTAATLFDPLAINQSSLASSSSSSVECHLEGTGSDALEQQLYVNLSTFWYCFLALITAVGLLISLISNMIIIYLFTSTPFLRKNPSNIIAVNLSLSDLLYCVQWPSVIYCSLTQSTWMLEYSIVCQSFGFITVSTALASILTVLAMSIERAIVIIYSIHARNKFTNKLAWMIIVLIWIVSISFSLPPLFGKFNRYTLDPSKTSCTLDYVSRQANYKLYILVLYVAYWIVPTIFITISYITIIVTFKKSSLDLKKISGGKTYTSTSSLLTVRGYHHLGKQLRDSLRLKGSSSNPEEHGTSCNYQHNSRLGCLIGRRASTSVVDLSSHHTTSSLTYDQHDTQGGGGNGGQVGGSPQNASPIRFYDRRKTLKRVVSSSALPSRSANNNQQIAVSHSYLTNLVHEETENKLAGNSTKENDELPANYSMKRAEIDRLRLNLLNRSRTSPASVSFKPQIVKTLSSIKTIHQQAANSQLTRTVLQFRLAKMSFYLILLWLVSWTPIASLAMINSVTKCPRASATAVFLASTMSKLGPALDVFIYGISHPKIKSRFKQIIRRLLFLDCLCFKAKLPLARQNS